MQSSNELLGIAEAYLKGEVAPVANEMDHDSEVLRKGLRGLCERGLMALRRPEAYGGPAMKESDFRQFQEMVARTSGALAFLQTQHQSAVSLIAKGDNRDLAARLLPLMHNGEELIGIGFSQLRRPGAPLLRAERKEGGYLLEGQVPWVTGLGFYTKFLVGAQLPDGKAVFGVIPFEHIQDPDGQIMLGPVMELVAMESAQTVPVDLHSWFMPDEDTVGEKPAGWIHTNDMINITLQGFFALGCAMAGVDLVESQSERRAPEFLKSVGAKLRSEIEDCREKMFAAQTASEETTKEKLELRAWAIELAVRCAHAAIAAIGGSAGMTKSPAQRIYREALVYTVSAQTTDIMQATLNRLT